MQRLLLSSILGLSVSCSKPYLEQCRAMGFQPKDANRIEVVLRANENMWCFRKAGIGTLGSHTYVITRSNWNEMILPDGTRWQGNSRQVQEMVVVSEGRLLQPSEMRPLLLNTCTVVSFKTDRIVFYDFQHEEGGAYERD